MLSNEPCPASSLSEYFGFDPKSPYAELFAHIFDLTKPNKVVIGAEDGTKEEEELEEGEAEDEPVDEPQESALNLSKENLDSKDSENMKRMKLPKDSIQWDQVNLQNQNHNRLSDKVNPFLYTPPLSTSQFQSISSMMSLPISMSSSMLTVSQPQPFLHLPPIQFPPSLGFPPMTVPPPTAPWSSRPFLLDLPLQPNLNHLTPQQNVIPPQLFPEKIPKDQFQESKGFDLKMLFEFDNNPERATWILKYLSYMASVGTPLTNCPSMHKEPLDLYKLFHLVISDGGFDKCSSNKTWKKISQKMTKNYKPSFLWRILQKQYRKHLLQYEKYSH